MIVGISLFVLACYIALLLCLANCLCNRLNASMMGSPREFRDLWWFVIEGGYKDIARSLCVRVRAAFCAIKLASRNESRNE